MIRQLPSSLQVSAQYELGEPQSTFFGFFGVLYPVYVRGQAYLELHQGLRAAAEFQKIIDHPTLVINDPVGALARLQLARAYAMAGDLPRARAAYTNFFQLWKDADANRPVLQQAKLESSRLN